MADSSMQYNWQPLVSCSQGRPKDLVRGGVIRGIASVKSIQPGSLALDNGVTLTDEMLKSAKYQIKHPDTRPSMYAPRENQAKYLDNPPK